MLQSLEPCSYLHCTNAQRAGNIELARPTPQSTNAQRAGNIELSRPTPQSTNAQNVGHINI